MGPGRSRARRRSAPARERLGPFGQGGLLCCGRFVGLPEVFAAALNRGDELGEVDLEGAEDLVGVALSTQANLALFGTGVVDDLLARELGHTRAVMLDD